MAMVRAISVTATGQGWQAGWLADRRHNISSASSNNNRNTTYTGLPSTPNANGIELSLQLQILLYLKDMMFVCGNWKMCLPKNVIFYRSNIR